MRRNRNAVSTEIFICLETTSRQISGVLASKFETCEMGHGDSAAGGCHKRRETKDS